jgi:hypothetical protein
MFGMPRSVSRRAVARPEMPAPIMSTGFRVGIVSVMVTVTKSSLEIPILGVLVKEIVRTQNPKRILF